MDTQLYINHRDSNVRRSYLDDLTGLPQSGHVRLVSVTNQPVLDFVHILIAVPGVTLTSPSTSNIWMASWSARAGVFGLADFGDPPTRGPVE